MRPRRILEVGLPRLLAWCLLGFLFVPILVVIPVALTDRDYCRCRRTAFRCSISRPWPTGARAGCQHADQRRHRAGLRGHRHRARRRLRRGRLGRRRLVAVPDAHPALSPMIVPPIIYAVGMVKLWARLSLLDSYTGVVPRACRTRPAADGDGDRRVAFESRPEAGAGRQEPRRQADDRLRQGDLPNIVPGVAAGALLAFVASGTRSPSQLFITGRAVVTLRDASGPASRTAVDPALAAIATVLLVITVLALIARSLVERRQRQRL